MGRSRYKQLEPWYPYLITSSFVHGLPLFAKPEIAQLLIDAIKFHQSKSELKVYAYCIMENHFHLIAKHDDFKICMQSIKSYTAKKVSDLLKSRNNKFYLKQLTSSKKRGKNQSTYQIWQEGYHPKQISTEKILRQKINYVHFNPVKRGYVDKPEDWRYSSARDYLGQLGLLEIERIV
jgi:REP element-mobilizing transposase RayT